MQKYLKMWFDLYLRLVALRPSESWLAVRLDTTPGKRIFNSQDQSVRVRVTAHEGGLIHDEIRAVIKLVDEFMEETDLPLQTEIQNNGIEITSLASPPRSSTGQDEDNQNALVWLNQGNVQSALRIGQREFIESALAERSFGPDVLVELADGKLGVIGGYNDGDPGTFAIDGVVDTDDTRGVTISNIERVISWSLDDEQRTIAKDLDLPVDRAGAAVALAARDETHFPSE